MNTLLAHPQEMWAAVVVLVVLVAAIVTLVVTDHEEFVMWALGGLAAIGLLVWWLLWISQ